MKQNRFKTLWGIALGLALLASAIPFTASAGFGGTRGDPPKPDEVVIELYGSVRGKRTASFVFEGKTIQYKGDGSMYPNPPFRVNGVLWEDMKTPFQLNFTPDFENASILEQSGHSFELFKGKDSFTVSIKNSQNTEWKYRIKIAAKYQKKRENAQPKTIPAQEIKNPPPLTTDGPTIVYGPMVISRINEPTDGMDHPDFSVSRPVNMHHQERGVVIKGTVDQWAGFRIQQNYIFYQNYMTLPIDGSGVSPVLKGGKFASGVTVNGKEWTNLSKPFGLDFIPKLSSEKTFQFKVDQCIIKYADHDDVLEVSIENKSDKPVPFEVLWTIRDPDAYK